MSRPIHHPPPDTAREAAGKPAGPLSESHPAPPGARPGATAWAFSPPEGHALVLALEVVAHLIQSPALSEEGGLFLSSKHVTLRLREGRSFAQGHTAE